MKKNNTRPFQIDDYPVFAMAHVVAAVQARIVGQVDGYALTASVWRVLAILAEHPGSSVKQVALSGVLERPALSRIIERLEHDGLVERADNPLDGRSSLIRLSRRGEALYRECAIAARAVMEQALAGFNKDERAQLAALVARMRSNVDARSGE